ncbi:hypothetical protein AVEN_74356-1 [Araneus ventricosus]|uniref:Uncharacterized protein n=1 Tax=Araneus ventricosus TaxID=182803 RepID=A0A4Y2PN97_ARAVE|nr:hypothetical protein AVEN_74356-1 [Araneus ventricosus]
MSIILLTYPLISPQIRAQIDYLDRFLYNTLKDGIEIIIFLDTLLSTSPKIVKIFADESLNFSQTGVGQFPPPPLSHSGAAPACSKKAANDIHPALRFWKKTQSNENRTKKRRKHSVIRIVRFVPDGSKAGDQRKRWVELVAVGLR